MIIGNPKKNLSSNKTKEFVQFNLRVIYELLILISEDFVFGSYQSRFSFQ